MQSRRDFITKTLGVAAGAAAAAYVAPGFTSVNSKPAYASITGGTTPSPTPTEEPTVPTTNSGSMFMGSGGIFIPGSDGVNTETISVIQGGLRESLTANVAGVAGGLVILKSSPITSLNTLDFIFMVNGVETDVRCSLSPSVPTTANSGSATAVVPAASIINFKAVGKGNSGLAGNAEFVFGWVWREI